MSTTKRSVDCLSENTMTIENYLAKTGVISRRETGTNQTEEEDVIISVGYFNIVRLN